MFPKQFKTQQYYNILKQICPEVEKAKPGALKSQRWGYPGLGGVHRAASLPPPPPPRDEAGISGGPPSALTLAMLPTPGSQT